MRKMLVDSTRGFKIRNSLPDIPEPNSNQGGSRLPTDLERGESEYRELIDQISKFMGAELGNQEAMVQHALRVSRYETYGKDTALGDYYVELLINRYSQIDQLTPEMQATSVLSLGLAYHTTEYAAVIAYSWGSDFEDEIDLEFYSPGTSKEHLIEEAEHNKEHAKKMYAQIRHKLRQAFHEQFTDIERRVNLLMVDPVFTHDNDIRDAFLLIDHNEVDNWYRQQETKEGKVLPFQPKMK